MVSNRAKRNVQNKKTTVSKPQVKKVRARKFSSEICSSGSRAWPQDNDIPEMPENSLVDCFEPAVVKTEIVEEENCSQVGPSTISNQLSSSLSLELREAYLEPVLQETVQGTVKHEMKPVLSETAAPIDGVIKSEPQEEFFGAPIVQMTKVQLLPIFLLPPVNNYPVPVSIVHPLSANNTVPPPIVVQKAQSKTKEVEENELKSVRERLNSLQNWESALLPAKYFRRCADDGPIWKKTVISIVKLDSGDGKTSSYYHILRNNWLDEIYMPRLYEGQPAKTIPAAYSSSFKADISGVTCDKMPRHHPANVVSQECLLETVTTFPHLRKALTVTRITPKQRIRSQHSSQTNSRPLDHCSTPTPHNQTSQCVASPLGLSSAPPRPLIKIGQRLILRPLSQTLLSTDKVQIPVKLKRSELPPGIRVIPKFPTFIRKRTFSISNKCNALKKAARDRARANEAFRLGHSSFGRQIRIPSVYNRSPDSVRKRYRCLMSACLQFPKRQANPLVLVGDLHRDFKEWVEKVDSNAARTEAEWRLLFDVKRGLAKPRNKKAGGRPLKKFRGRKAPEKNQKRKEDNETRREEVQTTHRELPTLTRLIADSQYTSNGTFIVQETEFDVETLWDIVSTVADLVAFTSFRMSRPATGVVPIISQHSSTKHHKSQLYYS